MKITHREKILLSILGIMLLFTVYYRLLFVPQKQKIETLKNRKIELENKLQSMSVEEHLNKQSKEQIKFLNANILETATPFFPSLEQERVIVLLEQWLGISNLSGKSFTFTENAIQEIKQEKIKGKNIEYPLQEWVQAYKAEEGTERGKEKAAEEISPKDGAVQKKEETKEAMVQAENINVELQFEGTYEELTTLIETIEAYEKKVIIQHLNINAGKENIIEGIITLEFYAVPKIIKEETPFTQWNYNGKYGKQNPFSIGSGTKAQGALRKEEEKRPDFLMTVKPTSSDLPTVVLGKANDPERSTYIYGDSAQEEKVELYIMEKEGEFYYKYKTSQMKYPKDFQKDGQLFQPLKEEEIAIQINVSKRNSLEDVSGVNFKVYNDTNRTVKLFIQGEDLTRPRVKVSAERGRVTIEK